MGVYLVDQVADLLSSSNVFLSDCWVFLEFCDPLFNARPLLVRCGFPRSRRVIYLVLHDVRHVESSQVWVSARRRVSPNSTSELSFPAC